MKKKIFLMLTMAAVLVCLFAFSVSAAEIPEWTEITEVENMPDKSVFGADGTKGATSRVLMSDGVTYPAYYIVKNSKSLGISFSDLNTKSGKAYEAADVIRLEVPKGVTSTPMSALKTENGFTALKTVSFPEGFTTLGGYTFKGTASIPSALVYVSLPSTLTDIGQSAFIDCASLEELIIPEGVSVIPTDMAKNATSLKTLVLPSTIRTIETTAFRSANLSGGVVIPEGCTTIGNYAFKGSGVTSVTLPSTIEAAGEAVFSECQSLTDIYSKSPIIGKQMFYDCDEIATITLENTVEIKDQGFCNPNSGILKISTLVLPEGLTTVGNYAFARSQITELVLPSTLSTIGSNVFDSSTSLTKVVVLGSALGSNMFNLCSNLNELVLTENFETFGSGALNNVSQTSFITYYTGTDYDRIKSVCSGTTRLSQAKYYSYADYESGNYTSNKFMVIYDTNLCVAAFDGIHTEPNDDGDCTQPLSVRFAPIIPIGKQCSI